MSHTKQAARILLWIALAIGILISAGCTSLPTATPSLTVAFRGMDGTLHVRWSSDGQTWLDPASFPSPVSLAQGPGLGGIPSGLSQLLVFNRGTNLYRLSSIGSAAYGTSPEEILQSGVTVDSPLSVAFTGSGHWLIGHRTGGDGVLRLWDGSSSLPVVVTPPGALNNLCSSDSLSGAIGPKVMQVNTKVLVAFCQRDSSGSESIQLLPGTLASNGVPTFTAQVPFTLTQPGFDAPFAKIYALAHDGTNFLLATIAPDSNQPRPLTTFGLMIFSSPDGQSWSFVGLTSTSTGINQSARSTPLGIAAIPPMGGNPALIQVAQYAGSALAPRVWEFNGASWTDRSNNNAFGAVAPDVSSGFAFRVNGMP